MKFYFDVIGFVFLDYSQFDGDEEGGGSLIGLLEALDDIWWPSIGVILLILVVTSIFKSVFIDAPNKRMAIHQFNRDYPSISDKQKYYDLKFEKGKAKIEKDWNEQREYYLKNFPDWLNYSPLQNLPEYDIKNLAHYAKQITREVVKQDYSSKGFILLREWWTYDGEWRRGYWDGQYNYRDGLWNAKTKCDFLRTDMGDNEPFNNQ
jgi:hypothetical protein